MNTFAAVFIIVSLASVALGFLNGLRRGAPRAGLRLLLTLVCVVIALLTLSPLTDGLLSRPLIEGQTVAEYIVSALGEDAAFLADAVMPLITILLRILLFFVVFAAAQLIASIAGFILKLFLPKGKMRGIGALIGAVQGALIAYCLIVPLNGLMAPAEKLLTLEVDGQALFEMDEKGRGAVDTITAYNSTPVSTLFTTLGEPLFGRLSTTVTGTGSTVTLGGQVEAIDASSQMTTEISGIASVDFSNGVDRDAVDTVRTHLNNLDGIRDGMSDEARETVNQLMQDVAEELDLPVDLSGIDLSAVDFSEEGELLESIYDYQSGETLDDLDAAVEQLSQSTLLLPVLQNAGVNIPLDEEQQNEIGAAIDLLEDAEAAASLRTLFGLAP